MREIAEATASFRKRRQRGDVRIARFPREKTPDQHPHAAFGVDGAAMQPAAQVWGEQLNPLERARLVGPERLVRFLAVQQVEFRSAFVDGRVNREAQHHHTDAVLPEPRVEAVLVQIEPAVDVKTVT